MTQEMETFTGSTQGAGGKFLGAKFWKKGKKIEGTVIDEFETANGPSWSVRLNSPASITIDKEELTVVSIGNLKGFLMALRDANVRDGLKHGDLIIVECVGETPTDKGNPQINFKVAVRRPKGKDNGNF